MNNRNTYGNVWCIVVCSAMNYSTPATGTLDIPTDENGEPLTDQAIDRINNHNGRTEFLVTSHNNEDSIYVDELVYTDGTIYITALFDDWYVNLQIPLRPNKALQEFLADMNKAFDITTRQSGYYLSSDDVDMVDTFTPDDQGRVTLGREYAGKEVRVIGSVEE